MFKPFLKNQVDSNSNNMCPINAESVLSRSMPLLFYLESIPINIKGRRLFFLNGQTEQIRSDKWYSGNLQIISHLCVLSYRLPHQKCGQTDLIPLSLVIVTVIMFQLVYGYKKFLIYLFTW